MVATTIPVAKVVITAGAHMAQATKVDRASILNMRSPIGLFDGFYYTRIGGIGNPLIGLVAVTDAVHGAAFFNAKTFVLALCYVELWEHTLCELLIAVITAFGHYQLGAWGQFA